MQRQSSIQQEEGTLTNPLLQGHHVHVHQTTSPDAAAPTDQALQTESLAETHAKVAEVVRAMRPLLLAWLAISVALVAELIAYLVAFAGSLRALTVQATFVYGLSVVVMGIFTPVAYHIPACLTPICKGRHTTAENHIKCLQSSWVWAMYAVLSGFHIVTTARQQLALNCEVPGQNCTASWWLHVALLSTFGVYALLAGCVAYSAKQHLRRLKQEREAAELAAEVKTADV